MNVFVIGDFMLDHYIEGNVERISPEAPVQILDVTNSYYKLGGAGNVVLNLAALGADVSCAAITGIDHESSIIRDELKKYCKTSNIIYQENCGIVKTRLIGSYGIQLIRYDKEPKKFNPTLLSDECLENCDDIIRQSDMIIVSDYAKITINKAIMTKLKSFNIPIIVDPKPKNLHLYQDVNYITPNKDELKQISEKYDSEQILNTIDYIIETRGEEGIFVHDKKYLIPCMIQPEKKRRVYNVSGAGDTVVAVFAICLCKGYDVLSAAKIANEAGGKVVEKPGTSTLTLDEFYEIQK